MFSLAWRIVGDRGVAEEIAQDVFLQFWRTQPEFVSEEHRKHWLRQVTAHRATDHLRQRMRRPVIVSDEALERQPATRVAGVPSALENRLDTLLQSLPAPMRAAIVLRYGEDEMSPEEIARLLGQPVATVKSNLQRALSLLRRKAETLLKEFVRNE